MKTLNELGVRCGMSPRAFERLLERIGWMKDGSLCREAVERGFVTPDGKVTVFGQGYIYQASRE